MLRGNPCCIAFKDLVLCTSTEAEHDPVLRERPRGTVPVPAGIACQDTKLIKTQLSSCVAQNLKSFKEM